jgi:hypothetical protein
MGGIGWYFFIFIPPIRVKIIKARFLSGPCNMFIFRCWVRSQVIETKIADEGLGQAGTKKRFAWLLR